MSNFDQIKVKLKLSIGFVVGNQEDEVFLSEYISEEEWMKLGFFEKDEFIQKRNSSRMGIRLYRDVSTY